MPSPGVSVPGSLRPLHDLWYGYWGVEKCAYEAVGSRGVGRLMHLLENVKQVTVDAADR